MVDPSEVSREPLLPDAHGYCYVNEQHFDETIARVARDHVAKSARSFERLVPLSLALIAYCALATCVTLGLAAGISVFSLVGIFLVLVIQRERRQIKRIEHLRLCFHCGYSLVATPTDFQGWGTCPECGARFNTAYYTRPPPLYARPPLPGA